MPAATDDRGLVFRQDYFHDSVALAGLVDLLRDIFLIDVSLLDQFGGPDPSSMPFGYFDAAGVCVANFSAFSMPVVIDGRPVKAAGFQSGAVRPQWRGRGLYRDLMRKAFGWTDEQDFELGLLLTDKPVLYEPYGFRTVPQHRFAGGPPPVLAPQGAATALTLPHEGPLIKALLLQRAPVSQRFAVTAQAEMFLLNACLDPDIRLSHLAERDVVAAWKLEGSCLTLLDVAGRSIPPLGVLIAALGLRPERIEVCFPPDRLEWNGTPQPYQGYTVLMARGMAAERLPDTIMLSPMAEF